MTELTKEELEQKILEWSNYIDKIKYDRCSDTMWYSGFLQAASMIQLHMTKSMPPLFFANKKKLLEENSQK